MGVNAKGIIKEVVSAEELADKLSREFGISDMAIIEKDSSLGIKAILCFTEPFGSGEGQKRTMYIFDGEHVQDDTAIWNDERTLLLLGSHGLSCDYLEFLASEYGGFVNKADWTQVWTHFEKGERYQRPSSAFCL